MTETSSETENQAGTETDSKPAEKTFTQTELNEILGQRLARVKEQYGDYEDLQAKAAELQQIKEAGKTEQQKLADQLTTLQQQLAEKDAQVAEATLTSMKASIAAEKGVPAASLTGSTQEELEASADQLIAWRDAAKPVRKPPMPSGLKSGASSSSDTSANPKEAAALALRRMFQPGA